MDCPPKRSGSMPAGRKAGAPITSAKTPADSTNMPGLKGIWEGALAPLIDQVMYENPNVYIKSNVKSDTIREGIELYLSTTAENQKMAENYLNKALTQISGLIREAMVKAEKSRHLKNRYLDDLSR